MFPHSTILRAMKWVKLRLLIHPFTHQSWTKGSLLGTVQCLRKELFRHVDWWIWDLNHQPLVVALFYLNAFWNLYVTASLRLADSSAALLSGPGMQSPSPAAASAPTGAQSTCHLCLGSAFLSCPISTTRQTVIESSVDSPDMRRSLVCSGGVSLRFFKYIWLISSKKKMNIGSVDELHKRVKATQHLSLRVAVLVASLLALVTGAWPTDEGPYGSREQGRTSVLEGSQGIFLPSLQGRICSSLRFCSNSSLTVPHGVSFFFHLFIYLLFFKS